MELDGEDMVPDGMALDLELPEPLEAGEDMVPDMVPDGEVMLLQEQTLELPEPLEAGEDMVPEHMEHMVPEHMVPDGEDTALDGEEDTEDMEVMVAGEVHT